jgi:hypothetical protein
VDLDSTPHYANLKKKFSSIMYLILAVLDALLVLRAGRSVNFLHDCETLSTLTGQLHCRHTLSTCTKGEQLIAIRFSWIEFVPRDKNPSQIFSTVWK